MSSLQELLSELREAEQDIDSKSSNLGQLRCEYVENAEALESQYYPLTAPLHAVVFACKDERALLELRVSWLERKIVLISQKGKRYHEATDAAPVKKELKDALQPTFEDAFRTMDAVTKEELEVLRAYEHPPDVVLKTIETIMKLRGEEDCSWAASRIMLSETYYRSFFVYKARLRVKQPVEDDTMAMLEAYSLDPETTPDRVASVSGPCAAMSMYLRAVRDLARIEKVCAPRTQTVPQLQEELEEVQKAIQRNKDEVAGTEKTLETLQEELRGRLLELQRRYDDTMVPLQELFFDAHHKFNDLYSSSSPTRQRDVVVAADIS